jgi:hypothetical protein
VEYISNTSFHIFHQHGTNKNEGICAVVEKHLKRVRVGFNVKNTVVVDVNGLYETNRIVATYWLTDQSRNLGELQSYISENTVLTSDFNAFIKEWLHCYKNFE